ncbi:MAG: TrfB-related DNA-binding protein [Candidatus Saccharibacteria bacterium]|nr:TrfB-related DNA-binding protein [Candidatus Saccharibacteria bacterium]
MSVIRLNASDLERLATEANIGVTARNIAYAVFVDGRTHSQVASEFNVTRQRVTFIVSAIRRAQEKTVLSSENIAEVNLTLPIGLATELEKVCDLISRCEDQNKQRAAYSKITRAVVSARLSLK